MTVDDCSKGRFLGVRAPPEAAAADVEALPRLLLLAGVDAAGGGAATLPGIAPRPRAGVAAIIVAADFPLGVASLAPESSAERRVVLPATVDASLGSVAATTAEEAAKF